MPAYGEVEVLQAMALFEGVGTQQMWLELSLANLKHLKEGILASEPLEKNRVVSKARK